MLKTAQYYWKKIQINEKHPYSWIRRLNIINISILAKAIYRSNTILSTIPMMFFAKIEKFILKIHFKESQVAKIILIKNKFKRFILSNFKAYYKAIVIKIESSETISPIY